MEVALEAGADDVELVDDYFEVTCDPKVFETVRKALEDAQDRHRERPRPATSRPPTSTSTSRTARRCSSSRDILDENDDVQNVYANDNIPEDAMAS